jgi:hypothetical protein
MDSYYVSYSLIVPEIFVAAGVSGTSSLCSPLIQSTSNAAMLRATYCASVFDFATVGCFLADQLTAAPLSMNTYPVVDL